MDQMRKTVAVGPKSALVPYRPEHVEEFHKWMQDISWGKSNFPDPVSLQEEHTIQDIWQKHEDACVFIILDRSLPETRAPRGQGGMAGYVNFDCSKTKNRDSAELEVMIGAPRSRRKGIASEALILVMLYAIKSLKTSTFFARFGFFDIPYKKMLSKLGFQEHSKCSTFKEYTYILEISESMKQQLVEGYTGKVVFFLAD